MKKHVRLNRYVGVKLIQLIVLILTFVVLPKLSSAQLAECHPDVPFFEVNLTGNPDSVWVSPNHIRNANCCGTTSPDRCTSFSVILDSDAAMINLEIASGAVPPGALYYQIGCGPQIPVGQPICIAGVGPHEITFCKPGNNTNTYRISSIAKPVFPDDLTTRVGCSAPFRMYGLTGITINSINSSTGNTTVGAFNNLLSCTNCNEPIFTPGIATPEWIDYQICGTPLASDCGYIYVCDTVRIYTKSALNVSVTPNPGVFCAGGSIEMTALATGGDLNYSYVWRTSEGVVVSNLSTYNATTQETYTVEVSDGLNTSTCPSEYESVSVIVGQPPIVDAGMDQTVCAQSPTVFLTGTIQNATGGIWTGGTGTFNPSNTSLLTAYTPSNAEILNGSVTLTLTSTGAGGGCTDDFDEVTIFFSDSVKVESIFNPIACNGGTTEVQANVTSGTAPFSYIWSNGSTSSSIIVPSGVYSVMVLDALGCGQTASVFVTNPDQLIVEVNSFLTSDPDPLICDGSATVTISGGAAPYSVLWNDPANQTSLTATGLCAPQSYQATIEDANGCIVIASTVVNNPLCSSLEIVIDSKVDVTCYGNTDGSAVASASGGDGNYSFLWNTSPVQNTATVNNLSAGNYEVTVTDGLGCQNITSVTILQPSVITNYITSTNVTTIGGSNGSATANPEGGVSPYQYVWTPSGQTTQTAINLSAGTYYATITDDNSCVKLDSVLINQPPCNNFLLAVNHTNVSCFGGNNGQASVIIAHGTPPYSIAWYKGGLPIASNVTSVSGLTSGNYTVEVTDDSNCSTFQSFDITEPNSLSLALVPTNISCFGFNDGTIDLTVTGGTYPYTYQWYVGVKLIADHEDLVGLASATYSVIVTDANGCSISGTVGITSPTALSTSYAKTDVSCNGYDDGAIDATVSGGTLPYSYLWSGPEGFTASTQDLSNLSGGLYELQIEDGNGCTLTTLMQTYVNEPSVVSVNGVDISCPIPGENLTIVEVTSISGGDGGPYSVSFDNGVTFLSSEVYSTSLEVGADYQIWAQDGNLCSTDGSFDISIDTTVVVDTVIFDSCIPEGAATILVTVEPVGGAVGDYEVSLDGGATFETAGEYTFNLSVDDTYSIVVRDVSGCLSLPYEIIIPAELIAVPSINNEVSCIGESDGSINLSVSGGTAPYSYEWTGPGAYSAITQNISELVTGIYEVTVTDNFGCTTVESIELTTFPDVIDPEITCPVDINVNNDASVCGAEVNYITPVGTDNCPGASTLMLQGLASGAIFPVGSTLVEYQVTDLAGNDATCSFNITVVDNELPTITCPADVNAVADLDECSIIGSSVNLGTPITDDNCGVDFVSNDAPAIYPVGTTIVIWTVQDIHGNIQTCEQQVIVEDDQAPIISSCGVIGNLDVESDAGVCTYTNLGTGWDVVATDNCTSITMEVTLSGATVFTGTSLDGVTFNSGLTLVTWTVTDDANNVSTCDFTITIEDTENPIITSCVGSNQTVDADLDECTFTVQDDTWDATATDNCGIVTITAELTGATTLSGLNTLQGVSFNLGTTTVTWTIEDNSGNSVQCIFDVIVEDNQLPTLVACLGSTQTVDADLDECTYTVNGSGWNATATDNCTISSIEAELTGATLASGLTTLNGVSFNLGTTTVIWTVTDNSGNSEQCVFDVVVEDNQLPALVACVGSAQTVDTDIDECTFTVIGTGWDATATDNCTITAIEAQLTGATLDSGLTTLNGVSFNLGTTTVTWTITDNSGNSVQCIFDVVVEDNQSPEITNCPSNISVSNDNGDCGAIVNWAVLGMTDNCTGSILTSSHNSGDFFDVGLTTVTYTATDGSGNETTCSFDVEVLDDELPAILCNAPIETCSPFVTYSSPVSNDNCGVASVTMIEGLASGSDFPVGTTAVTYQVVDINGNSNTCSFDVTVFPLPELTISAEDVSCFGFGDGTLDLTVTDGTGPYTYSWSNGADTEDLTMLEPGIYNVVVSDVNGCSGSEQVSISQPNPLSVSAELIHVLCNEGSNGSIDLEVQGGVTPYTYEWTNGETTQDINNLVAGNYGAIITDANGCTIEYGATITEPTALSIQHQVYNSTCNAPNGSVQVQVTGGVTPYSYNWSNGSTMANLNNVIAGDYSLIVTDVNGCTVEINVTISAESNIIADISGQNVTCAGRNNGSARVTVITGNAPFTYQWSNGDTESTITDLAPGIYTLTITDAFGCEADLTITITEPELLEVSLEPSVYSGNFNIYPYGNNNGSIDAIVTGGTQPYSYYWSDGQNTPGINNLTTGDYSVVVTDENGCTVFASVILTQPMILEMPNGFSPNGDGKNDYFVIRGLDGYPSNDFTIFNRWGNVVFQKNNYDNTWEGTNNNGELLPDATYFVILNVEGIDGSITLKGFIDLRR